MWQDWVAFRLPTNKHELEKEQDKHASVDKSQSTHILFKVAPPGMDRNTHQKGVIVLTSKWRPHNLQAWPHLKTQCSSIVRTSTNKCYMQNCDPYLIFSQLCYLSLLFPLEDVYETSSYWILLLAVLCCSVDWPFELSSRVCPLLSSISGNACLSPLDSS